MKLTVDTFINNKTGDFIKNVYYLDGEAITEDDYESILDAQIIDEGTNDYYDNNEECDCSICDEKDCEFREEEEDKSLTFADEESAETYMDLIDDYTEMILETEGCENCIKERLIDMFEEVLDLFEFDVDESEDENYEDECDCEKCEKCDLPECECQCDKCDDEEDFRELLETFADEIDMNGDYEEDIETLRDLYELAYEDGRKSLALFISDRMADVVEE